MKIKDLIKRLERNGWYLARVKGSHRQFRHSQKPGTITVAGKLSADMPKGTLHVVLKKAGLK